MRAITGDALTTFAPCAISRGLVVLGLLLCGCGSGTSTSGPSSAPSSQSTGASSTSSPPPGGGAASIPLASLIPDPRLKAVQFATAVGPDGAAQNPTTTFHASSDRRIIAVLSLGDVAVGTSLGFIRYLDGKLVDSRTSSVAKRAAYFYFEFTALPGKQFTPGQYLLRLYVDGRATAEAGFLLVA